MRKFLLAVLSFIFVICMGSAVACGCDDGNYHLVTFRKTNGVTYVSAVNSNKGFANGVWEVKEGVTLTFKVELSEDAKGDLIVYSNDDVLTADEKGVYSTVIMSDTEISVDGIDAVGDYNRLVIPSTPGVVVNLLNVDGEETLKNGMMVRSGTEVKFSLTVAEGFYGTPVVYANEEVLTAENNVYSFVMEKPTTIKVEGIMKNITLRFNKGDTRVDYIGTDGIYFDTDTDIAEKYGAEIVFDVKISVYYDVSLGYELQANTTIISPQADGHYHVTLEDNTTISVSGLQQDAALDENDRPFRGQGNGTQANPYKLSRPIDLYLMSTLVNDEFYIGNYSNSYYELTADIDLDGEQLFVIGDGSSGYAYFGGHFNGNGHTISNYYITDSRIDQTEFNQLYLTNVGVFGYVMPGLNRAPVIENLVLDNFTISADASRTSATLQSYTLCVGALAGASFGATVTGVIAKNGKMVVTGGNDNGAYVGGLIGQQFSEYGAEDSSAKFDSAVISCMTDVDISITSSGNSYVFATGGISGALIVGDEHYTAFILNCYSTGDIEGGQNAGGIVGYAYNHTAISNCYSTGEVRAIASFAISENYLESVYYANAGGIVGYAEYSTVIANSFSTGYISAQSSKGASFCKISGTVADKDGESDLGNADAILPTTLNLHGGVKSITSDFIFGTLGWSESDWKIADGQPVHNSIAAPSINVAFSVDSAFGTVSSVTLKSYKSLAGWDHETGNAGIPEYISGNGGYRSYGYFFDKELTEKVPRSYVITSDMTLYVGYADYSEVVGVYYLGDYTTDSIILELRQDGTCVYREGALNQATVYSWDGANLIIYYSAIGALSKLEADSVFFDEYFGSYYIYSGTVEEGVLSVYGGRIDELGYDDKGNIVYTGNVLYLFPENQPLKGYMQVDGFKYGGYYYEGGTYTFFMNGTGLFESLVKNSSFTYVFTDDNKIDITFENGDKAVATVNGDGYVVDVDTESVLLFDEFKGTWEKSFSTDKKYTFDGKGGWTYSGNGGTSSGTYSINEGVLTDVMGAFTARFVDGLLEITTDKISDTFYKEGSFTGVWYFNGVTSEGGDIAVGITFDGIGAIGYGNAHVRYFSGASYEVTYEYQVEDGANNVLLYYRDLVFGLLSYNSSNATLSGVMNGHQARFTVYDVLMGKWIGDNGNSVTSAEFNGNGLYNLGGDRDTGAIGVSGSVRINGGQRVSYSLDRKTLEGSFTYNGVSYKIVYHEDSDTIELTGNSGSFYLVMPDSWYGRELKDGAGNVYTFDGKSSSPAGGKISVSDGSSYSYKLDGDTIVLTDSNATISLGKDGNNNSVYVLSLESGDLYLTLNTPFTGDWAIGGMGGTLTISNVYADNTASGSYTLYKQTEKNIALTYYPDGNYLTYEENGTVYRITATKVGDSYQLSFGGSKCIPAQLADELRGKAFTILNSSGQPDGQIVFDGLGGYLYSNGSAVVLNASGERVQTLIYGTNYYGDWRVIFNDYEYVFVECEENTEFEETVLYRLKEGDKYFAIVSPDGLYRYEAKDSSDHDTRYIFNGCGEVRCVLSSGEIKIYTYKIVKLNTTFKHELEFTDENGTYSVILDLSSSYYEDWNITFVQE